MKKNLFNLLICTAIVSLMALTACGDNGKTPEPKPTVNNELSGSITGTKTLDAGVEYLITGPVIVEDGGVLNIPAGTVIKAKKGFSNYILVLQGGKIYAKGTAEKPVKMTADANGAPGHWGGLIINGKAKVSGDWSGAKTPTGSTEINTAYLYGGTNDADNSGELTYLILEYTGAKSSADVEHNGLTLNAVGNGTKIENIYIPNGADDGIEFFGGSVNVKNLLVVNSDDDMFDVTQGWIGTLENCYGIWETGYSSEESDPRGVESDGNLDGKFPDHTRQSDFTIKNMTIDLRLAASTNVKSQMQDVIKVRRGAKATIVNALVKGTGTAQDIIDLTGSDANPATAISLTNSLTGFTGKEINKNAEIPFANVKIEAGNTGCATNIFSWTGYKF